MLQYIYHHYHQSLLLSLCHAARTDFPVPLSSLVPLIHHSWQVYQATCYISLELLLLSSSRSSNLCSSVWRRPLEYIAYEFVLTFSAMSCMSGSSNLDVFLDGWDVASRVGSIQLVVFLFNCRQAFSPYA